MPRIKSAVKRAKVTKKKTMVNRMTRSRMTTAIKKFRAAVLNNDAAGAEKLLPGAFKEIDGAASAGVIHWKNANRKKSRLSKTLRDLKSGKLVAAVKAAPAKKTAAKAAKEAAPAAAAAEGGSADVKGAKEAAAPEEKPAPAEKSEKKEKGDKKADKKAEKEKKSKEKEEAKSAKKK